MTDVLIRRDWDTYIQLKDHVKTHGDVTHADGHLQAKEKGPEQILPSQPQKKQPC